MAASVSASAARSASVKKGVSHQVTRLCKGVMAEAFEAWRDRLPALAVTADDGS
ncbi:hypothetical protein [Nonomuraea sp. B1E8]|uniref:hypothetical protein n=1 Tax=unclassified Nonomuraea TaxID=2593643 RepID=UPI00325D195C